MILYNCSRIDRRGAIMQKFEVTLRSSHHNKPFLADITYIADGKPKPVIVFNHGFKGYKDWGPFNLMASHFAQSGFVFIKMNFSHNGTTPDRPTEFADLEAFAQNNFSKELDDAGVLIDALFTGNLNIPDPEIDLERFFAIGHSRGGASAVLKASEDERIKKVVTWAGVNDIESRYSEDELAQWKKAGTIYIYNSRTEQQMPMHYQLVEDFLRNKSRLDVPAAIKNIGVPMLAIHGTEDETVPAECLLLTKSWNPDVETAKIEGANHTFGGTEPYPHQTLPGDLQKVIQHTISFLKK